MILEMAMAQAQAQGYKVYKSTRDWIRQNVCLFIHSIMLQISIHQFDRYAAPSCT